MYIFLKPVTYLYLLSILTVLQPIRYSGLTCLWLQARKDSPPLTHMHFEVLVLLFLKHQQLK